MTAVIIDVDSSSDIVGIGNARATLTTTLDCCPFLDTIRSI